MTKEEAVEKLINSKVSIKQGLNGQYVVMDGYSGTILLDDNQGYGYKTIRKAYQGWTYKKTNRYEGLVYQVGQALENK